MSYQDYKEELDKLKREIDLENFLLNHGFRKDPRKSTHSTPVYVGSGERLIVRKGNDCKIYYKRGSEEQGTIIHFLKYHPELLVKFPDKNIYQSIKKYLYDYLGSFPYNQSLNEEKLITYKFDPTIFFCPIQKNITDPEFSYLQHRGITSETLNSSVFTNIGYATIKNLDKGTCYNNVAVPLFDRELQLKGIEHRYESYGKYYKSFVPGSEKKNTLGISSSKRTGIKKLILCEDFIDAMSHYQMYYPGKTDIQYVYFNGYLCKEQIQLFLDYYKTLNLNHKSPNIITAFDNDPDGNLTGQAYTTSILCSLITERPVPYAYSSNDKFSFVFSEKVLENQKLFINLLQNIPEIDFIETEQSFKFIFPKKKTVINSINKNLTKFSSHLSNMIPLTKDWNDDLKMKNYCLSQLSKKETNNSIKKI